MVLKAESPGKATLNLCDIGDKILTPPYPVGLQENEMRKYVHSALGLREHCFSSVYNPRVPQRTLLQGPAPEFPTFPPSPSWFHPQGVSPCYLSTAWLTVPAGYQRAAACPR